MTQAAHRAIARVMTQSPVGNLVKVLKTVSPAVTLKPLISILKVREATQCLEDAHFLGISQEVEDAQEAEGGLIATEAADILNLRTEINLNTSHTHTYL